MSAPDTMRAYDFVFVFSLLLVSIVCNLCIRDCRYARTYTCVREERVPSCTKRNRPSSTAAVLLKTDVVWPVKYVIGSIKSRHLQQLRWAAAAAAAAAADN